MIYLIDGAVVLLFVLMVVIGHHRGFIKTVTGLVALVAALLVSWMLSTPVAQIAYDVAVEPIVTTTIEEQVGENSPAAESIDAALADMPSFIQNMLANGGIRSGADVMEKLSGTAEGATVGETVATQIVEPVVLPLLKAVCMLLLFVITLVAAHILLRVLNVVAKLPLLKQLNKGLGAVAGAITGVLWVFIAVSVLQVIAATSATDGAITVEMLEATWFVDWLCSINPVAGALEEILVFIPSGRYAVE